MDARKEHGYTREEIAKEVGVQPDTYKAYEVGIRTPRLETMRLIMDKLENSSIFLFDNEER